MRMVVLFLLVGSVSTILGINSILTMAYGQSVNNQTSSNATLGSQFTVNIRGISSFTEPNMVALISTEDDVQVKKVDGDKETLIEPGQEDSFSPSKMLDVTIQMNKAVKPNTEVMACNIIQLGNADFSQRVNCNTVFFGIWKHK